MLPFGSTRNAVRRRSGCLNCRNRRKKCDETRPECLACVRRGIKCSGYNKPIVFKDVSEKAAESSRRFEAARWAELRLADEKRTQGGNDPDDKKISTPTLTPTPTPTLTPHDETASTSQCDVDTAHNDLDPYQEMTWREDDDSIWLDNLGYTPQLRVFNTALGFLGHDTSSLSSSQQIEEVAELNFLASDACTFPALSDSTFDLSLTSNTLSLSTAPNGSPQSVTGTNAPLSSLTPPSESSTVASQAQAATCSSTNNSSINVPASAPEPLLFKGRMIGSCLTGTAELSRPLEMSRSSEEGLLSYFREHIAPRIPVDLEFSSLFNGSSYFRAAVLALSASSMKLRHGNISTDGEAMFRRYSGGNGLLYYHTALCELKKSLKQPAQSNNEQIANTYVILAYHDMEVDSPLGVRYFASCVDDMASKMESEVYMTPGLFKAWRMLRCEKRFLSLATRATTPMSDEWEACSSFDHQLAIKSLLVSIWKLHSRYAMEASVPSSDGESALEQVGKWIRSVLNRDCDRQQAEQRDFHTQDLTTDAILKQCDRFDRELDQWHYMLPEGDLPVPKLRNCNDVITGPSFDPIITHWLPDEDKSMSYVTYLVARMACNYLRSVFDPSCKAPVTEILGKTALGIACGMNLRRRCFSMLRLHNVILMIVLLTESTTISAIVSDYLIPRALSQDLTQPEIAVWQYLRSVIQLIAQERLRGKAIRLVIDGSGGGNLPGQLLEPHGLVAFGDYYGKGHFCETYRI